MTPTPPPLLPATALDRVGKLARFDGLTVLAVAGCFATVSLAMRDWAGAAICFGAVGAGASEWRWNLTDPRGQTVQAGIYLLRAQLGTQTWTRRVTVVR